ncbi:cytochrome c biogenesis protein CcdA [Candidatus Bipolaricaulota sp. J31]
MAMNLFRLGLLLGTVLAVVAPASGVELVFFYDPGCPHCARIEVFLEEIAPDYPELRVIRFNVREPESRDVLEKLLAAYGVELGPVPLIFVGDVALIGDTFYGLEEEPVTLFGRAGEMALEEAIQRAIATNVPSPLARAEGVQGKDLAERLTLPAVLVAAAVDSVNPCCFAVLIFLFGTLLVAGRRRKILPIGLSFLSAIYISYFLMGLGVYSAIQAVGVQYYFILSVSILAVLMGFWNVKDYFAHGKWFSLEVPQRWRPLLKRLTASVVSVPGAFAIGILDSLFLLPCSSGPYIAILALISRTTTRAQGVLYLLLYNLVFVLPLLILTLGVHFGFTTTARAERWRAQRVKKLHLISGIVMFLLGAGMIAALQLGYV